MMPTDIWEWDAEAEEVVALDVSDTRNGDAVPVDFTDEPVGILAAAAPDMARELNHLVRLLEPLEKEGGLEVPGLATLNGARAALRKAGVS